MAYRERHAESSSLGKEPRGLGPLPFVKLLCCRVGPSLVLEDPRLHLEVRRSDRDVTSGTKRLEGCDTATSLVYTDVYTRGCEPTEASLSSADVPHRLWESARFHEDAVLTNGFTSTGDSGNPWQVKGELKSLDLVLDLTMGNLSRSTLWTIWDYPLGMGLRSWRK